MSAAKLGTVANIKPFQKRDYNNNNKGSVMTSISECFLAAVHCVSNPEPIKNRLAQAWLEHLDSIDSGQLPEEIRANFIGLRNAMYDRKPLYFESAPLASIRKMSTLEAATHVQTIVTLYSDLLRINTQRSITTAAAPSKVRGRSGRTARIQPQLN